MAKVESVPSQGYLLEFSTESEALLHGGHFVGGENKFRGATCPNCKKVLLQLLLIDAQDKLLGLEGIWPWPKLPLLYCWTCEAASRRISYRLVSPELIHLIEFKSGQASDDFPRPNYPTAFSPKRVRLVALTAEQQHQIILANGGALSGDEAAEPFVNFPRHQIGGVPLLMNAEVPPIQKCPICRKHTPFIASVCDDAGGSSFAENEFVHVLFNICCRCKVLIAEHMCD